MAILQHKTWTKKSLAVAVNREDSRKKLEKFSQQNWIVARGVQRILEKTSFLTKKIEKETALFCSSLSKGA